LSKADVEANLSTILRGSETILVVEDEPDVRDLACEFLKVSGYSVLEAHNGLEAVEVLARHSGTIHVVLSDVVMPKMGGRELADRLRTLRPHTRVVLMSGYSEYFNGPRDPNISPALMLQKPFSRASLLEKIREALSGNAVEQASTLRGV
jgi:CheY-like chemotaxis protein